MESLFLDLADVMFVSLLFLDRILLFLLGAGRFSCCCYLTAPVGDAVRVAGSGRGQVLYLEG